MIDELVKEAFEAALENDFDFSDLSDEFIADDMINCGVFNKYKFSTEEILASIGRVRNEVRYS